MSMARLSRPRAPRPPRIGPLLFLPLLILAVVTACGDRAAERAQRPPSAPESIAPRGAVSPPVSFTWKQVPGDWIYRLIVTDEAERPMYQQDIRNGSALPMDPELAAMMTEQHATFIWSVAIVTPDGRHLAESPRVKFSLK
jgi:hypothetical protein